MTLKKTFSVVSFLFNTSEHHVHAKAQQVWERCDAIFLHLFADGAESTAVESKSQINKTILKVLYRHQVIQLVAEICTKGQKYISILNHASSKICHL